jgi:hypothetical protein
MDPGKKLRTIFRSRRDRNIAWIRTFKKMNMSSDRHPILQSLIEPNAYLKIDQETFVKNLLATTSAIIATFCQECHYCLLVMMAVGPFG